MLLTNLASVVGNYRALGIGRFVLAGWVGRRTRARRHAIDHGHADARGAPDARVRGDRRAATVPDQTTGRADDMAQTAAWLAAGAGEGLEDLAIPNEGPAVEVATTILDWMGWS